MGLLKSVIRVCIISEKYAEALALIRNSLDFETDFSVVLEGLQVCINYLELQDFAISLADRGLKAYPGNELILFAKGVAHSILGDKAIY